VNAAIADLASKYADRPREDRLAATRAYCDSDGVYRLTILKVSDVETWVADNWDRFMPTMVAW
jgi:hypothetical protein